MFFYKRLAIVYCGIKYNLLFKSKNTSFVDERMPNKLKISDSESDLISPISHISFWKKGEMAYSALKKINELKANNELEKAKVMLDDWIF